MTWEKKDGSIVKEFEFKDFSKALEFVNNVAVLAEKADHHPDIFLHSYNKVKITLSTHSEGKVTEKDYDLAREIDKIF